MLIAESLDGQESDNIQNVHRNPGKTVYFYRPGTGNVVLEVVPECLFSRRMESSWPAVNLSA
jgi:hypothetical protein